jgi:hypothetical protein
LHLTPQEERIWWEGRRIHGELQEAARSGRSSTAAQDPRYRKEREQRRAKVLKEIEEETGESGVVV